MPSNPRDYSLAAEGPADHVRNALAILQTFNEAVLPRYATYRAPSAHDANNKLAFLLGDLNATLAGIRGRLEKALTQIEGGSGGTHT